MRISFDDFKYNLRANLMLKEIPITELPKIDVIDCLYTEHRTVENATNIILKRRKEKENDKIREDSNIIDF